MAAHSSDPPATVLAPMKVNAIVLNEASCDPSNHFSIAPITQPNYTFLRLHDNLIEADILDHADLHEVKPAKLNPRVFDIGKGQVRQKRLGVYIHWTLPQFYRSGSAAAPDQSQNQANKKLSQGFPSDTTNKFGATEDYGVPEFRPIPNRWLVIRRLDPKSNAPSTFPTIQSWVVESDRMRNINDLSDDTDLEVDVVPFVNPKDIDPKDSKGVIIEGQAEVFIGKTTDTTDFDPQEADAAPRVDLTVLASSNPLFADYQPHNSSVLSIVDNFMYWPNGKGDDKSPAFLDSAICDYFVVGWHTDPDKDPFTTATGITPPSHATRLGDCSMKLKNPKTGTAGSWSSDSTPTRILCHGAMYDVEYKADSLPTTVAAENAYTHLAEKQAISIGVTAMDALLAYCRSHSSPSDKSLLSELEQDIVRIQTLLNATESDDVDALQAAADEVFEQAFDKVDGGIKWYFHQKAGGAQAGSTNSTAVSRKAVKTASQTTQDSRKPSSSDIQNIHDLNGYQSLQNNTLRELSRKRWQLFAEWWLYASGFGENKARTDYIADVTSISQRIGELLGVSGSKGRQAELQAQIDALIAKLTDPLVQKAPQQGAEERFYQRKEPTILFGGIKSGFEPDFADTLQVRISDQVVLPTGDENAAGWNGFTQHIDWVLTRIKAPDQLKKSLRAVCMEFYALRNTSTPIMKVDSPQVLPWFHNEDDHTVNRHESRGRDLWQGVQPWCPLFIEYEAVYYHIPFEKWKLKDSPRLSNWGSSVAHYGFDEDIGQLHIDDKRTISGRVILTPQVASTLGSTLKQIFQNTNPTQLANDFNMPKSEQDTLLASIGLLDFTSAPLTGLTADLLTLHDGGMHVKPTVRLPNAAPIVIQAAADAVGDIGMNADMLKLMDTETTFIPYGTSVDLDSTSSPCKLATHGQMMFTKLNIIDKFGQAISAIDPSRQARGAPRLTLIPCLSDTYYPGTVGDKNPTDPDARPNIVIPRTDAACPFIQLPPAINQPARINASFVTKENGDWRPCTEWEDPIWGWVMMNYPDQGLQVFFGDGTFYREIRKGGRNGSKAGLKYLPFEKPSAIGPNVRGRDIVQLDYLIQCLSDRTYFDNFCDMVTASSSYQAMAPSSFSTYSSAIVGKPLALVNSGWSLELAGEPNTNQSTQNRQTPSPNLLDIDTNGKYISFAPDDPRGYTFQIKLGDKERNYDGLVGFFPAMGTNAPHISTSAASTTTQPVTSPGGTGLLSSDLDLQSLYTFFSDNSKTPLEPIQSLNYPKFTPYWFPSGKSGDPLPDHNSKLSVFGMLLDPFLPVHAYSGILPIKSLTLPQWAVETALKKISAFFHAGPLLIPTDMLGDYDLKRALVDEYAETALNSTKMSTGSDNKAVIIPKIPLPLVQPTDKTDGTDKEWRWLQPYSLRLDDGHGGKIQSTSFNAFEISADSSSGGDARQAKLSPAPYTIVEGFLQLL